MSCLVWVLKTNLNSSGRAANVLNHRAISLALGRVLNGATPRSLVGHVTEAVLLPQRQSVEQPHPAYGHEQSEEGTCGGRIRNLKLNRLHHQVGRAVS